MATMTNTITSLTPPVTVEQWGELDGETRYDLVDGHLKQRPDEPFWHAILLTDLIVSLHNYVDSRRLGLFIGGKAKLKISKFDGREPDIFFIPRSLYHLVEKNLFKGIPPLVIEIVSPISEQEDCMDKFRQYASFGIGQYWVVDFPHRRIEVYELREQPNMARDYVLAETVSGDAVFRPSFFPGLEIPLAKIWPTEFENRTDD
jgi:Uma2 family endonuclease